MFTTELFEYAYIPGWHNHLDMLAEMALPEPWKYRNMGDRKNTRTPILDKYINYVFRNQMIDYQNAQSAIGADEAILIRNEYTVLNTGLLTRYMKPIYAYFERNKREGFVPDWFFKGFMDDSAVPLKFIHPLPKKPFSGIQHAVIAYLAHLPLRVNVVHILNDPNNFARIPPQFQSFGNLPLLLETAVEMTRRMAELRPSIIVAQMYQGCIQYLMPICLSDPSQPDLAMTVSPMGGFYLCNTCLTLEMAYSNARLLATPTAPWLTALVE